MHTDAMCINMCVCTLLRYIYTYSYFIYISYICICVWFIGVYIDNQVIQEIFIVTEHLSVLTIQGYA